MFCYSVLHLDISYQGLSLSFSRIFPNWCCCNLWVWFVPVTSVGFPEPIWNLHHFFLGHACISWPLILLLSWRLACILGKFHAQCFLTCSIFLFARLLIGFYYHWQSWMFFQMHFGVCLTTLGHVVSLVWVSVTSICMWTDDPYSLDSIGNYNEANLYGWRP